MDAFTKLVYDGAKQHMKPNTIHVGINSGSTRRMTLAMKHSCTITSHAVMHTQLR